MTLLSFFRKVMSGLVLTFSLFVAAVGLAGAQTFSSSTWTFNNNGSGIGAPAITNGGNTLQIATDGVYGTYNSAWYNTQQSATQFTETFQYQASYNQINDSGLSPADGATFAIQNDTVDGLNALGFGGSDLGYSNEQGGPTNPLTNSVAVAFNIYGGHNVGTNLIFDGTNDTGGVFNYITPTVNLNEVESVDPITGLVVYDPVNVLLTYNDGSNILSEELTNAVTNQSQVINYNVGNLFGAEFGSAYDNYTIPDILGGNSGWFGFTGGNGAGTAEQDISTFNVTPVATTITPESSSVVNILAALLGVGLCAVVARRRSRRTS